MDGEEEGKGDPDRRTEKECSAPPAHATQRLSTRPAFDHGRFGEPSFFRLQAEVGFGEGEETWLFSE
jgi:hypothetical protein